MACLSVPQEFQWGVNPQIYNFGEQHKKFLPQTRLLRWLYQRTAAVNILHQVMGFYIITFKLDLGKMKQQWLSNVNENSSKIGQGLISLVYIWQNSALVDGSTEKTKISLTRSYNILDTFPKHRFHLFAEVYQECVAGWVAKETFDSNLHLQLSQLKHHDLYPSYSVSSPASQTWLLTTDSPHVKGHTEHIISPQTSCFLL